MPRIRTISALIAGCILLILATLSAAYAQGGRGDWWMVGHDPQHTGRSPFVGPSLPTEKWAFQTKDYYQETAPVIGADGVIYIGTGDYRIFAVNPNGTKRWEYYLGGPVWTAPAIGADGTVYVSCDGQLFALSPEGILKWKVENGADLSPVIGQDGTIYIIGWQKLRAINPDGSEKWAVENVAYPPVIGIGGTIYSASLNGKLCAIGTDGTKIWQSSDYGPPLAIGDDGTIYTSLHDDYQETRLVALSFDGTKKWEAPVKWYVLSAAIAADGTIMCVCYDSAGTELIAISTDGQRKWDYMAGGFTPPSPIAIDANGTTYMSSSGSVTAISPNGIMIWQYQQGGGLAMGSDGTLYIAGYYNLYALGPGESAAPPYISISGPSVSGTTNGPVSYNVAYTNATYVDLRAKNIQLNSTGTAHGTVSVSYEGNDSWIVTISDIGGDGTLGISVKAGTASNPTGKAPAAGPCTPFEVDSERIIPGDWSMYGHDMQHTGRSSYAGPALPLIKWSCDSGFWYSSLCPVIDSNGTIYGGTGSRLNAINPDSSAKWNSTLEYDLGSCAPAIGMDGTIYASNDKGKLYSVNAKGHVWWTFDAGEFTRLTSPTIGSDGTIYAGSTGNKLYAIMPDGSEKWEFSVSGNIYAAPAIGPDGTIYVETYSDGKLYAVTPNGVKKWEVAIKDWFVSGISIGLDGTVYVTSDSDTVYAFSPDGLKKWEFNTIGSIYSTPAIGADGTAYVGCRNMLYALNQNGTEKWKLPFAEYSCPTSVIVDSQGTIYVGLESGEFHAINPNGTEKWSIGMLGGLYSTPAIGSDGVIYLGSNDGILYAIGADNSTKPPSISIGEPHDITGYCAEYTVTYSDASVITLASDDIEVNTTGTVQGYASISYVDFNTRAVRLTCSSGNGTIGFSIKAGTAINSAGSAPAAGPSTTFNVVNPPDVSIGPPSATSLKKGSVSYVITYTDADSVTLNADDIFLIWTGTANGKVAVSGSGNTTRTVTISNITGVGTLGIAIYAGTAHNLAGDAYATGPSDMVAVVNTRPTLTISQPCIDITTTGPVVYYANYTGTGVITLKASDVKLIKTGTANGVVSVEGSGSEYRQIIISNITGDGTLGISIAAGTAKNAVDYARAAGPSARFKVVNTPPGIKISAPSHSTTASGPITYTITYSHADSIDLTDANVHLNRTGTANGAIHVTESGPNTRKVTIGYITGDGTLGISIDAGTAYNIAGSTASAGPSATFNVVNTAPGIEISGPSVGSTTKGPVTYTVRYTNATAIFLATHYLRLNKTGTAAGIIKVSRAGADTRTVTISCIRGCGTLSLSITAKSASNPAGFAPAIGPSQAVNVGNAKAKG